MHQTGPGELLIIQTIGTANRSLAKDRMLHNVYLRTSQPCRHIVDNAQSTVLSSEVFITINQCTEERYDYIDIWQ